MKKGAELLTRLLDFSVAALELSSRLPKSHAGRHVAQQLIRSATGGGSNYAEARAAESRADFVHKLGVAAKELNEASYWVALAVRIRWVPDAKHLEDECDQLAAILAASARTARSRADG